MTLKELMTGALQQLDRSTDSQTVEAWRDKLTRYLNDAIIDVAADLQLRRTDAVGITDGQIDTSSLPRECMKVVALRRDGVRLPFYYGVGTGRLHVPAAKDGPAELTYRYVPGALEADTDTPDLPESAHPALMMYAVGRERASGDGASLKAARACFEVYHAAKRRLRNHQGEADAYRIENRY